MLISFLGNHFLYSVEISIFIRSIRKQIMNKTQIKKLAKYQKELDLAERLVRDHGFIIYGDLFIDYEKPFSKDRLELSFAFKDTQDRRFRAERYKTGWAIKISESPRYSGGEYCNDKFMFSDRVYYAFPEGFDGSDMFNKAPIEVAFDTFMKNFEEAYIKVENETLSVEWTKGIGTHSHTYPSGEGTFYINASRKYNEKHP